MAVYNKQTWVNGPEGGTPLEATRLQHIEDGIVAVDTTGGAVTSVAGKTGTVSLVKGDVGLGNVDNTADAAKPVSTAQAAANATATANAQATSLQKASNLNDVPSPSAARTNLGLGNVDNTSDANKPVSTAQAAANALALAKASNLSDLASPSTARSNLGLGTAATQPTSAFDTSGAASALALSNVAAIATANGALTIGVHNPVDASGGARTMTLANAATPGQVVSFEKTDSSANTVAVTLNLRGTPASTLTLVWQNETIELRGKADGSWWPVAGHKTKASIDAEILALGNGTYERLHSYDVTDFGASASATDSVNNTAFAAAFAAAAGKPVYVPKGEFKVSLSLTDEDVHLIGPGTLIHQQAKSVISIKRTLGNPIAVSSFGSVQVGPNLPSVGTIGTETDTTLNLGSTSLVGIKQGDLFLLSSQDQYPWCGALATLTGNGSTTVWQTGFVPVQSIGLTVTLSGAISEGDTITGATSGAVGVALSAVASPSGTIVTFGSVSADFTSGENLTVGGTVQGTANGIGYLVMSGRLLDTYTTSPVLRKVPTGGKFVIDGLRVKASGDVDSIVGTANRLPAFILAGVYKPQVRNFTIDSAWTRCWQVLSCYGGTFDVQINKLPNNANSSEAAYGYGVEFAGATEQCTAIVNGGNCRHGFTTNVFWGGFSFMDPTATGTPKFNTVRDSFIRNALSVSFDTHWGCYYQTFINCRSVASTSGARIVSGCGGFQIGGFGTSFIDCHDHGSVVGFVEAVGTLDAGFPHVIRYRDCVAESFQQYGFFLNTDVSSNNAKIDWSDCEARGDGVTTTSTYYQAGWYLRGAVMSLNRCTARRFNGAPFYYNSASGRMDMNDFLADYFETAVSTAGGRFDNAPGEINIRNYRVRPSTSVNSPASVFRVAGGTVVLSLDGYSMLGGSSIPAIANVTGGSLTINWKTAAQAVRATTTVGDTNPTVVPRNSNPVQIFNTPLTANRTVTLSTSSGVPINGDSFRVVRTAASTGAFTLTVAGKALSAGQWADVAYDGSAWQLVASGSL